jgi:hypothetical protein
MKNEQKKGIIILSHKDKKTGKYVQSEYITVGLRVAMFREKYPEYSIITEEIENTENKVKFVAKILNEQGRIIATGTSEQFRTDGFINKFSGLQHAETSAVGRALAFFHGDFMGTDYHIASAEDMQQAFNEQQQQQEKGNTFYVADDEKIRTWENEWGKTGIDPKQEKKWLKIMHDAQEKTEMKIAHIKRDVNAIFPKGKDWCMKLLYLFEGIDYNTSANSFEKKLQYLKEQGI